MLKSISVHAYYKIFCPCCTSDKINIIMTWVGTMFVYFFAGRQIFLGRVRFCCSFLQVTLQEKLVMLSGRLPLIID
jgi:hypothetical protein